MCVCVCVHVHVQLKLWSPPAAAAAVAGAGPKLLQTIRLNLSGEEGDGVSESARERESQCHLGLDPRSEFLVLCSTTPEQYKLYALHLRVRGPAAAAAAALCCCCCCCSLFLLLLLLLLPLLILMLV